jgi:hypothetical protein
MLLMLTLLTPESNFGSAYKDAANQICTTRGVFEHTQASFWRCADTRVHTHGGNFEHLWYV